MKKETETVVTEVTEEQDGFTVYEIGFHLVPTTPEEELGARASDIRAQIEDVGGSVIAEGFPTLTPLAYTIVGKGGKFDRAYFGWTKFEMAPVGVASLKEFADQNPSILRYLIIKTTRDGGADARKPLIHIGGETTPEDSDELKAPISEAELDKSLEEIIAE